MTSVAIGIHVYAEPEWLGATLHSLAANTDPAAEIILLPDGPDQPTGQLLQSLHPRQVAGPEPAGAPVCFNRLVRATDADVIVFLESGVQVGPAWLDRLLEPLRTEPRTGLAGPTTNRSWNQQGVPLRVTGSSRNIAEAATQIARRFGSTWRSLAPLHSLADFCYAVRRDVCTSIGEADEAYGRGPCWEMDYNIRAARAGFRGVWACGAYVHRAPPTERRRSDEARLFEANKRRYQDKFCGLRLRGDRGSYENHCRGDACEHFAPRAAIGIAVSRRSTAVRAVDAPPLVSCIMPTRDRCEFVRQSITYFQRQTLTAAELLILDDGAADLRDDLPADDRIRYVRTPRGESIGAKRNRAVAMARGRFIAHWDDDDLYAPMRLERQLAPLLAGSAEITGLITGVMFVMPTWQFWRVTPALHRRLFLHDVHGGTLVYDKRLWEQGARYPARSIAEDACCLERMIRAGGRLERIAGDDLFVYLRHGANAWRFECGRYLDPHGWLGVDEPAMLAPDRQFYLTLRNRSVESSDGAAGPLVSCIMPTADRPRFVGRAIEYFQRQDYASIELLVLDDGKDPVSNLVPADQRVRYERLPVRRVLGAKRNLACEMARGDIIVHWDDDDWMSRNRVSRQVAALLRAPSAEVCGLADLAFYAPATCQAWLYRYRLAGRPWAAGNTLCYWKRAWARKPFAAVPEGEDTRFVWNFSQRTVHTMSDDSFFVGIVHRRNTSPKRTHGAQWSPTDPAPIRARLGGDLEFYDGLTNEPATFAVPRTPARGEP